MSECSSCGAAWPTEGQVCLYCGSVIPERLVAHAQAKQEQEDRLANVWHNLAILRQMPLPKVGDALLQVLWWYLVIGTFGILYFFWKRPKGDFNYQIYQRTLARVKRGASDALQVCNAEEAAKLRGVDAELRVIERVVGAGRRRYTKAVIIAVGLILLLGVIGSAVEDKSADAKKPTTEQKE